jgi:hypothetical protein
MLPKRKRRPVIRCTLRSKVRFRSAAKARQAMREHRNADVPLFIYQCPACGGWHVTSSPPRNGGEAVTG